MIAYGSGCLVAGLALALAPVAAHAQSAYLPLPVKAPPSNGLPGTGYLFGSYPPSDPIQSWLAMVSATQAAQPSWMTPLVTVTPRLEQEFRFDYYDQQNGTGSQGNGQHFVNYGGPGGARIEFIPAYNWEVIVAPPPYVTASGPKGSARRLGRLAGVSGQISVGFGKRAERRLYRHRLLSDVGSARHGLAISTNVMVAQPTLAFGKGWGDFDIQMTFSQQFPVELARPTAKNRHHAGQFRRSGALEHRLPISFHGVFLAGTRGQLRILAERHASGSQPGLAHAGHHIRPLQDRHGQPDADRST